MTLKEQDVKQLIDKNFMFLTLLGYGTSIIFHLQSIIENYNALIPEHLLDQIDWFKTAIENIVYKNIPAPRMP